MHCEGRGGSWVIFCCEAGNRERVKTESDVLFPSALSPPPFNAKVYLPANCCCPPGGAAGLLTSPLLRHPSGMLATMSALMLPTTATVATMGAAPGQHIPLLAVPTSKPIYEGQHKMFATSTNKSGMFICTLQIHPYEYLSYIVAIIVIILLARGREEEEFFWRMRKRYLLNWSFSVCRTCVGRYDFEDITVVISTVWGDGESFVRWEGKRGMYMISIYIHNRMVKLIYSLDWWRRFRSSNSIDFQSSKWKRRRWSGLLCGWWGWMCESEWGRVNVDTGRKYM